MTTVTIAIASTGRPSLARCLASIAALINPMSHVIDVVIADDSPDGSVARLLREHPGLPFKTAVIITAAHNVAIARNACLNAATGDYIAFIDDDEWAEPDWLSRMFACLADFNADCVFGPVHPIYPVGTERWIIDANPLHVDWGKRGRRVSVGRGGNTLFKRAIAEQHHLRFDPALGRTGGEDTQFFHRYGQTGATMVVTDDAIIREHAPKARVNIAYFRARAMRTGQIYARFVVGETARTPLARATFYAGAFAKAVIAHGAGILVYPVNQALWLRLAMRGWMNVGKLRELFGFAPTHMS